MQEVSLPVVSSEFRQRLTHDQTNFSSVGLFAQSAGRAIQKRCPPSWPRGLIPARRPTSGNQTIGVPRAGSAGACSRRVTDQHHGLGSCGGGRARRARKRGAADHREAAGRTAYGAPGLCRLSIQTLLRRARRGKRVTQLRSRGDAPVFAAGSTRVFELSSRDIPELSMASATMEGRHPAPEQGESLSNDRVEGFYFVTRGRGRFASPTE
jgi:hypothetical protein